MAASDNIVLKSLIIIENNILLTINWKLFIFK